MEITTRREAKERGLTVYCTGLTCVNGHRSYRYVQSGTCAECVKLANEKIKQLPEILTPSEHRDLALTLVQFRVRLVEIDVDYFRTIVFNTARLRHQGIRMRDLWGRDGGTSRVEGTALFKFNCFPADLEALKATANAMYKSRLTQTVQRPPAPDYDHNGEKISEQYWPEGDPR